MKGWEPLIREGSFHLLLVFTQFTFYRMSVQVLKSTDYREH